jgi:hypothetical protein
VKPNSDHAINRRAGKTTTPQSNPPKSSHPAKPNASNWAVRSQGQSKQDRVVAMLRQKEGTTIAGVMKATGWQKHSVHGFFAGVVRKKLSLTLVSEKSNGERVYRITGSNHAKKSEPSRRKRAA